MKSSQGGFSLLEISLAMILGGILAISYLYNQIRDEQINSAKVQAGYFLQVSDAVGRYMQNYYDDLIVVPAVCGNLTWADGLVSSATSTNCTFTTGSASGMKSPVNAMAPTVAELQNLDMLDKSFSNSFLWATVKPDSAGYVTRIQKWCDSVLVSSEPSNCSSAFQLKSLTFNSLAFDKPDTGNFFRLLRYEQLETAINVMGGDGFMSLEPEVDTEGSGKLYSVGKKISIDNPVKLASGSGGGNKGSAGILAVQNGVDVRCSAQRR